MKEVQLLQDQLKQSTRRYGRPLWMRHSPIRHSSVLRLLSLSNGVVVASVQGPMATVPAVFYVWRVDVHGRIRVFRFVHKVACCRDNKEGLGV